MGGCWLSLTGWLLLLLLLLQQLPPPFWLLLSGCFLTRTACRSLSSCCRWQATGSGAIVATTCNAGTVSDTGLGVIEASALAGPYTCFA